VKTIAITIDEETLARIDELAASSDRFSSRSALVRDALAAYVARARRLEEEERERRIIRKHKQRLNEQLEALVDEQAKA
jgi:metal-responsive CopG/Arc/MetJ family transcriptional regulator